jgi:hypothetical protein
MEEEFEDTKGYSEAVYQRRREEMGQPGQRLFTATESIDSWLGKKSIVFCSGYNEEYLFLKYTINI